MPPAPAPALALAERPHDPPTDGQRAGLSPAQRAALLIVVGACLAILGPAESEARPDRPTTPTAAPRPRPEA
jgi:hypothetical protein